MRALRCIIVCMLPVLLAACDVHEWPDAPERVPLYLRLNYEADMTLWEHLYSETGVTEQGTGDTYDNRRERGEMRYIVRACPLSGQGEAREYVLTKDIAEGYEHGVKLELEPGDYTIMVWSDLAENAGKDRCYNADDFAGISLQGEHEGNSEYRDAFRGMSDVSLEAGIVESDPDTLDVAMQRPLAKYEFISTDVAEFAEKEARRIAARMAGTDAAQYDGDGELSRINVEDYRVVFYYVGFMPDTYSMLTDKPVDSSTGVMFSSTLKYLSENEVSLGFDYVFVNGVESAVTVRIGVYDDEGRQLSLTDPIEVPVKRNRHTVMRGRFLMSEASGGVVINPDYDGDHNVFFP